MIIEYTFRILDVSQFLAVACAPSTGRFGHLIKSRTAKVLATCAKTFEQI